jgi:hypothetical protein
MDELKGSAACSVACIPAMPGCISVKALSRALSFFSGCPQWIQNVFNSVNTIILKGGKSSGSI